MSLGKTADKILESKDVFLEDKHHNNHQAAKRLDVILAGAHDIFAADVYIHQSCYISFVIKAVNPKSPDEYLQEKDNDVKTLFAYKARTSILKDKAAYLTHELLKDVAFISDEQGLEE